MTAAQDEPLAVGIARVAKQLDLSEKTIRRRLQSGVWRGFRVGNRWRISVGEIRRILAGQAGR